jgi:hypothetical protein
MAIQNAGVFCAEGGGSAVGLDLPKSFRVRPHLQLLDENRVAVVWMTSAKTTGYVTWSQDGWKTTHTAWCETDGLLDANSYQHKAVIVGFNPHLKLEYRAHSRTFGNFGPYSVSYVGEEETVGGTMNAILPDDGSVSWAMVNDVHENLEIYDKIVGHFDGVSSFCVFNGDIINHVDDEEDVAQRLLAPFARVSQEARLPVWYLRGNHETRGCFARSLRDYLALKDGRYYGAVTLGGARFAFLDTGEDKPDSHKEYSGLVAFDRYLEVQNAWLEREVASAEWKNAKARVVVRHIPSGGMVNEGRQWNPNLPRLGRMDAILKNAGVTLAMAGHTHFWDWQDPTAARPYPVIVGGGPKLGDPKDRRNATLVKSRLSGGTLVVKLLDQTGAVALEKKILVADASSEVSGTSKRVIEQ